VWCCVVALALASPAWLHASPGMPGIPPSEPAPLPPSGTSASPPTSSGPTTTPSPVSASAQPPPASPSPAQSPGPGVVPDSTAQPAVATTDATTDAEDTPVTPRDTDPTRFHFNGRATIATGVGGGGRIDLVSFGDPAGNRRSHGYLVQSTGSIAAWVRVVGYAERQGKRGRPLFFVLPDIALSFHLGGSRSGSDAVAAENNHNVYRSGPYIGQFGHANIAGGVASSGRIGGYGKGSIGARYLVGGGPEGAYAMVPVGIGGGLRLGLRPGLTVLIGPKVDAVLGGHGIGGSTVLEPATMDKDAVLRGWSGVAQLAPGGDLVVQARSKRNVYFGLLATADVTALGRLYGGQRIFGRTTIDVAIPMTPGLRLTLFATYTGWRATAAPNTVPFAAEGQTWSTHTFLLGVGVGL
jgi:hypothetical protein